MQYIPLRLVDHFEPDITLKDHEEKIHGVRARKHDADEIVLESGWVNLCLNSAYKRMTPSFSKRGNLTSKFSSLRKPHHLF